MADKEIPITPLGGLNQDDSLFVPPPGSGGISPFEQGDYRYALNARIGSSIEDNSSSVENFPSTLAVSNYYVWDGAAFVLSSAPAGTNTALNKFEDREESKLYYFVKNSNGDHQILMFVKYERKIYEILKWSGLNFNNPISSCKINKYLIFTDYDNAPRMVDVTDVYRLKYTLGVNFSEFHISFAKWAPGMPPLVTAYTSETNDYMEDGAFQFTYRYIYKGGFKSTLAQPSAFMSNRFNNNINYVFKISLPGYIYDKENDSFFTHAASKFYEFVEYIELAYRESELENWKIFQRHPVSSVGSENQTFYFRNNGSVAVIPAIEGNQYNDAVPFKSGACEAIDNRPMFADNEDELEVPDFEVEDVQVYSNSTTSWNALGTPFAGLSGAMQTIKTGQYYLQQYSFKSGGIYKLGIVFRHHTGRTSLAISPDNWIYQIPRYPSVVLSPTQFEFFHALGFNIPNTIDPPEWADSYSIVRTNCLNIEFFIQGVCNDVKFLGKNTAASPLEDFKTIPTSIQTIINERSNATDPSEDIDLARMLASAYRDDIEVATFSLAGRIYFDCNNWINSSKANGLGTTSFKSNDVFYNFRKGDRIRFVGIGLSATAEYFDEEIVEFTGRGFIINKPSTLSNMYRISSGSWVSAYSQVEIYRPKPVNLESTQFFYEIGEWYPITSPGTPSRDFIKRDFRWTNQATVTGSLIGDNLYPIYDQMPVFTGDVWTIEKNFFYDYVAASSDKNGISTMLKFSQMNQNPENAGGRWNHNQGRPFVGYEYIPTEFRKEGQVRFGLKFLEDSLFIGINTFLERHQFIYPAEYGRIRAMVNTSNAQVESVGNVLLVIGEQESWSVYVNRTTLEDLSGRSQVAISDKVLGSYNTLLGSHGTLNPESISKESGMVLWWNAKRGVWIRYSRDGLTEVSKYQMKNWFKDLGDLLSQYYYTGTAPKVLSVFDDYHEEWLTYITHSSLPATFKGYSSYKCVSFAERNADKRWKSVWDYAPDLFASLDNEVYSIIGSAIHIHEQGADFGSIYGVKKDTKLELVANPEYRKNKIWKSVALISSDKWEFPSILGDWKSNAATRQETEILLAQLKELEDTYWADMRRDGNSPNAANFEEGVVKGRSMRSKTLVLNLTLDPSVDYLSVFHWLNVSYDYSEKNVKN